jgi:hypothetical protein
MRNPHLLCESKSEIARDLAHFPVSLENPKVKSAESSSKTLKSAQQQSE